MKDFIKMHKFGKFRGIRRCTEMDVCVYELLRQGKTKTATAQVAQNIKAKIQCVLSQGHWTAAWLLWHARGS